jgi:hypothetical protein
MMMMTKKHVYATTLTVEHVDCGIQLGFLPPRSQFEIHFFQREALKFQGTFTMDDGTPELREES